MLIIADSDVRCSHSIVIGICFFTDCAYREQTEDPYPEQDPGVMEPSPLECGTEWNYILKTYMLHAPSLREVFKWMCMPLSNSEFSTS